MTFSALTPQFAVSPQLAPQDLEQAVAQGFKTVINNRPDFEVGPEQPTSAQMKAAAEALGVKSGPRGLELSECRKSQDPEISFPPLPRQQVGQPVR